MTRYRTLKPETFADEKLNDCSVEVRFLFVGLWCFVDDMGRRQYHPKRIKMEVFPGDERITPKVVDGWMRDLDRAGVIRIYTVNGQTFFWLPHFLRHQHVDKPSHSDLPPHPDDPDPSCQCFTCRVEREEISPNHHNRSRLPKAQNVPDFTRRVVLEHSGTLGVVPYHSSNERERERVSTKNQNQDQNHKLQALADLHSQAVALTSQENRRTQRAAFDEITKRMISLLELKVSPKLLEVSTRSIEMKSKSKDCSYEAAAQQIAARAAFVSAESPPIDWVDWFIDAGYEYVPQDDPRLKDKHIYARPVCGGPRCQEGWEVVKVEGLPVLRRCPDCEQLWKDQGK